MDINKKFNELIERAKQGSKDDFLRFVTGIYGIDECVFENMWKVPVIASWNGDSLITTSLSTKTKDDLLDIVDDFINQKLGDSDGCFISLSQMQSEFTDKELEEWRKKLDSGELKLNYNAIIVYNERTLINKYIYLKKLNSESPKPKTPEELDQIFFDYIKGVITHERCHLNANYYVTEVRKNEFHSEEINGALISSWEFDDDIFKRKEDLAVDTERNEVLIDTLRQMMNNYHEGDSIEDCLYKIIKNRNGRKQYKELDDREVLTMYILFPEELTKWATFGAYDFIRENKLKKMIMDVCGTDKQLEPTPFKKKVKEYVASLKEGTLSEKQIEMLEMLLLVIIKSNNFNENER